MREILKIKCKDKEVLIEYSVTRKIEDGQSFVDHITLDSNEEPHPDFAAAMVELSSYACEMLEAPNDWIQQTKVTGITFNRESANWGAVLTMQRQLKHSNSPLNLNTPYFSLEGSGEKNVFPPGAKDALEKVVVEAAAYIDGKRRQLQLGLDESQRKAS